MGMDDTHMKIRGAPVLDEPALSPHQKMIADKLAVSELMSMAVVALPPVVKVHFHPSFPPLYRILHSVHLLEASGFTSDILGYCAVRDDCSPSRLLHSIPRAPLTAVMED